MILVAYSTTAEGRTMGDRSAYAVFDRRADAEEFVTELRMKTPLDVVFQPSPDSDGRWVVEWTGSEPLVLKVLAQLDGPYVMPTVGEA